MLYYVPLEHIDKRYTIMQDDVTQKVFHIYDIDYEIINGVILSNELNKKQFLNPYSTNYFKFSQLQKISELFNNNIIKNDDIFYFSDLWFPGIESIKYMAYFKDINIKIYGILHAGSFTPTDTVNGMSEWAKYFERMLLKLSDGIFLGSEQTRQDIIKQYNDITYEELNKLQVTGLAYDSAQVEKYKTTEFDKEDIIIFPHRLHVEKQLELFKTLQQHFPKVEFIVTQDLDLSKEEYYKLLARSKIMFSASLQENFGYAVLEACSLNVTPILPINNTCYKYMYPKSILYNNYEEAVKLIEYYLHNTIDLTSIPRKYDTAVSKQMEFILKQNGK